MTEAALACFHCGEPCPASPLWLERDGARQPLCCAGCRAVAEFIFGSGLSRYYTFRSAPALRPEPAAAELSGAETEGWVALDGRTDLYGPALGDGWHELLLQLEGVQCAACAWLIRSRVEPLPEVRRVQVDLATGYTRIEWRPGTTFNLSRLAGELSRIGFRPHLPLAGAEVRGRLEERRDALLRMGVAGLGMMQVMMFAVGLYAGEALGISEGAKAFLEWTSLLVSVPVVFYSGRPFFSNALAGLRVGRARMDLPVALAITLAFAASCLNFLRGSGAVYFDSVVMFIFFLSIARYVQLAQRQRLVDAGAALARLLPEWAELLDDTGGVRRIPAADLKSGQRVRVPPGAAFPADGRLISGATEVNEALLTGEAMPRSRCAGDAVVGGSINLLQPVDFEVTATGSELTVAVLGRRLLAARANGGRLASMAERLAGGFILAVLVLAGATAVFWAWREPAQALPAALAVLVVSCPCALSLATPAALAAAGRGLLKRGVLLARAGALEALARADTVIFDKTGTLTRGQPRILSLRLNPERAGLGEDRVRALAAALEAHSGHPLAQAFIAAPSLPVLAAEESRVVPGVGLTGRIDGVQYWLGRDPDAGLSLQSPTQADVQSSRQADTGVGTNPGTSADSVAGRQADTGAGTNPSSLADSEADRQASGATLVWLSDTQGWLACFELGDGLRADAVATLADLRAAGLAVELLSGDNPAAVRAVAEELGISHWQARQTPEDKLARLRALQSQGRVVLVVGDGVNDGPVLAGADASVAVQGASQLANSAADLVLCGAPLASLVEVLAQARRTRRVVRQNLAWALAYNALAVPLASASLLQPWMAALGMSASSLLVVLNATRLARGSRAAA